MGHSTTESLAARYQAVQATLAVACHAAGRAREAVQLVAVSKTRTAAEIRALTTLGQRHFAENYLSEALPKIAALADLPLCWHFIGPLQSNKTVDIARHFDWVHSVDRPKVARRLNDQRPSSRPPLAVCIQVNIDAEASKAGVAIDQVADLAGQIATLPQLSLRGLMAIPRPDSEDQGRAAFRQLAMTLSSIRNTIAGPGVLSMGMSDDVAVAIAEGATHVRLGTALFGPRPAPLTGTEDR